MEDSMKTRLGVASINALAGDWSEQMVAIRQAIAAARKAAICKTCGCAPIRASMPSKF